MAITTHILDTSLGRPAVGVLVELRCAAASWEEASAVAVASLSAPLAAVRTNPDGRASFPANPPLHAGIYILRFVTGPYFADQRRESFYPAVEIAFTVHEPSQHYHVPLLLSPFGYSTYRGS